MAGRAPGGAHDGLSHAERVKRQAEQRRLEELERREAVLDQARREVRWVCVVGDLLEKEIEKEVELLLLFVVTAMEDGLTTGFPLSPLWLCPPCPPLQCTR